MNKFYDDMCLKIIAYSEELIADTPKFEIEKQEKLREIIRLTSRILWGIKRNRALTDIRHNRVITDENQDSDGSQS